MELEKIVAANLTELRKSKEWTQLELAEKINYSDKTVSKWERGEGLPDLKTICQLAGLFGVTVDYFITEGATENIKQYSAPKEERGYRLGISCLAVSCVWLAITVIYVYFFIYKGAGPWTLFVWGAPISSAVILYLNKKWGKSLVSIIASSVFCWSFISSAYLQLLTHGYNMWAIFFIGVPLQIALILWYFIKTKYKT